MNKLKLLRFLFPKKYSAPPPRGDRTFLRFDTSQIEDKNVLDVVILTGCKECDIKPKMRIIYEETEV